MIITKNFDQNYSEFPYLLEQYNYDFDNNLCMTRTIAGLTKEEAEKFVMARLAEPVVEDLKSEVNRRWF